MWTGGFCFCCVLLSEKFPRDEINFFFSFLCFFPFKAQTSTAKFFLAFYSAEKDINTFYMYLIFLLLFFFLVGWRREIYVAASRAFELSKLFLPLGKPICSIVFSMKNVLLLQNVFVCSKSVLNVPPKSFYFCIYTLSGIFYSYTHRKMEVFTGIYRHS